MKKLLLLFIVLSNLFNGYAQEAYWQQQLNYNINVKLIDSSNLLQGQMSLNYTNHSPDSLTFIWFHIYPNAFKNDQTAFSDQLLQNGRTDFYFSAEEDKGYLNRLNFLVDGTLAHFEDHPQHQEIIKLILPNSLAPGKTVQIKTGFQVKLPLHFSRMGHYKNSFQVAYWYPKPAVYDRNGWHPMPYLDQGEFYSEFADYTVKITLPKKYIVAATGNLIYEKPLNSLEKELQYQQQNIIDFAWFADKDFLVTKDSLLINQQKIALQIYHYQNDSVWNKALTYAKAALLAKANLIGPYPYGHLSIVESKLHNGTGGMEYPTLCFISEPKNNLMLNYLINHEVGHQWFYAALASNERAFPFMDEGMNSFYDNKYMLKNYGITEPTTTVNLPAFFKKRMPDSFQNLYLETLIKNKKDQPINTAAQKFSEYQYGLIAYTKAAQWMQQVETYLGKDVFEKSLQQYYQSWKFKHPYPKDFKNSIESTSQKNIDSLFNLLYTKGSLVKPQQNKIKLTSFYNFNNTKKNKYIAVAPAIGLNFYDGFMPGILLHHYQLPPSNFQFFISGLYGTKSKKINGLAHLSYDQYLGNNGRKIRWSLAAAHFTVDNFTDSTNTVNQQRYHKIVPAITYVFAHKNPRSTKLKYLQWKTFFISETNLLFTRDTVLNQYNITYPKSNRYLNQLKFVVAENRVLYPYQASVEINQGKDFIRAGFTGNYFFNYVKEGGLEVRLFAGKFIYTTPKNFINQFTTERYQLNLSAAKGYEDFTYENYFYGRNEFEGFSAQQIRLKDGAFKVRTDLLSNKIGKTDNWLAAINLNSTIPKSINPLSVLPIKLPLKVFADVGTYAEAWDKNGGESKILYDAGLQLSLLHNQINIYFPLLYSKVYRDYFKSTITEKRFLKNISFSIDLNNGILKKMFPNLNF